MRGGKFLLAKQKRPRQGVLKLLRNGSGIVAIEGGQKEIWIPERALFGASQGDLVEVEIDGGTRNRRPEGRIVKVIKREQTELVGLYQESRGECYVLPLDTSPAAAIRVTGTRPKSLQHDQIVVVKLSETLEQHQSLYGEIREVLGDASDPTVEMRVVARRFGIPTTFPEEVSSSAGQISQVVTAEECRLRKDLRHLPFVTIDGETAKDFDDAVTVRRESEGGGYHLSVAIADVAHYVPESSPIDNEALARGTSVYLPGTCLPMLPESLSNGICSLNPHVDRLVLVVEIHLDRSAAVVACDFSEAVIRSQARLTYTEVQHLLDQSPLPTPDKPYLEQLPIMQELAEKLTRMRLRRGALDLDIPEAEIVLDADGRPLSVVRAKRTMAHRLIEEFMLAANEAVASSLTMDGFPLLYRIHEPPVEQDLESFFRLARRLGAAADQNDPLLNRLQKTLASLEDESEVRILSRFLLRSLKQACYHSENRGHFGLASEHYCHFTSPIRRYPDLMVHRVLKQKLAGAEGETLKLQTKGRYSNLAEQLSKAERRAIDAERDASAMKTCQYMVKHVGETHPGHIASVHPFGFFVELDAVFVEGMVHVASMGDSYYRYEDETGRLIGENNQIYETGTPVTVTVRAVNVQRREIDFSIARSADQARTGSGRARGRRRK